MRKVFFILHYPPPIHGAAMVGNLIKESQTINSAFDSKYINLSTSVSVDDIGKGGVKKIVRYLQLLINTFWQGLIWRPDLVYITLTSHGLGLFKDSFIVLICRTLNLPHVFHLHNKGVKEYSKTWLGKIIYPLVFKKAKVILLSPILYSDIQDFVSQSNVYFCANGISSSSENRMITGNQNNSIINLLFLSNLIISKGILNLLESCVFLKERDLPFLCNIAGGDGDLNEGELLGLIKEYGLQEKVSYLGRVSGTRKTEIFRTSDIFIHPTKEDCFPLVLLEAFNFGLPIITTSEGAISEIVENNVTGLIIPKNNPEELANKIEYLIKYPEIRFQMGKAGREKFDRNYRLEIFEKNFVSVLTQILNA